MTGIARRHRADTSTDGASLVLEAEGDAAELSTMLRVTAVVTLSDGTREGVMLHGDPAELGARVAVLVYPRPLDIHRVDLIAADGSLLPDDR